MEQVKEAKNLSIRWNIEAHQLRVESRACLQICVVVETMWLPWSFLSNCFKSRRKMIRLAKGRNATRFVSAFCRCTVSESMSFCSATMPIVELREYELHPSHAPLYLEVTSRGADLRKSLSPLRIFAMPETGGKLNVATHIYYYEGGSDERNSRRAIMGRNNEWKEYLKQARPCVANQKSTIFVEAPFVARTEGVLGLATTAKHSVFDKSKSDCVLELRRYQLKFGDIVVPKFLELYEAGLRSKHRAHGMDPTTSLITLLCSEVGQLNEVIEVWMHGSGMAAMKRSSAAAREAQGWRDAISEIADLANVCTSIIYKPLSFSPFP